MCVCAVLKGCCGLEGRFYKERACMTMTTTFIIILLDCVLPLDIIEQQGA